ncbi:DUF3892 domain-containing protein [Pseudomonas sp. NPDC098740]|uniref:DUF3892 domain-containing protein n=1 Tax=Pseudomonas sp. NPDC098740 TaxID=3364486 RepID=UPI00383B12E9
MVATKWLLQGKLIRKETMMQFFIYKIRVDKSSGNIVAVAAFGKGEGGKASWVPIGFVTQLIRQGVPFNTYFERGGKWVSGAKIEVYENDFLRTVANGTERDNLESLPTEKV